MNKIRLLTYYASKSNGIRKITSIPYSLSIKFFIRLCENFIQIKSVYTRNSFAKNQWIPGLSDVDFSIIIDMKDSNHCSEFNFLESFWGKFFRLKKIFPMLGEIEIFDLEDLLFYKHFHHKSEGLNYWEKVYGTEIRGTLKENVGFDENLFESLDILFHHINPRLGFSKSLLNSIILDRLSEKIRKSAGQENQEGDFFQILDAECKKHLIDFEGLDNIKPKPLSDRVILIFQREHKLIINDIWLVKDFTGLTEIYLVIINDGIDLERLKSIEQNFPKACFFILTENIARYTIEKCFPQFLVNKKYGIFCLHNTGPVNFPTEKMFENSLKQYLSTLPPVLRQRFVKFNGIFEPNLLARIIQINNKFGKATNEYDIVELIDFFKNSSDEDIFNELMKKTKNAISIIKNS